jgi:hypothetical protein
MGFADGPELKFHMDALDPETGPACCKNKPTANNSSLYIML